MVTFTYKKTLFEITEKVDEVSVFESAITKPDVLLEMCLLLEKEEVNKVKRQKGAVSLLLPSYVVDLRCAEEEIFQNIHRSTRRNIKKAIADPSLKYAELTNPSDDDIAEFSNFYDVFAKEVGIKKCDTGKLIAIRDQGSLVITSVLDENNRMLCAHAHLYNKKQAYGIYSALVRGSDEEKVDGQTVGKANKYLDWKNIKNAKERGCSWYNFGGKIVDPDDEKGKNVNEYKAAFGSKIAYDFRVYSPRSLLGKAFVLLIHFYYKWKRKHEYAFTNEVLKQYS